MSADDNIGNAANAAFVENDTDALWALARDNWPPIAEKLPDGIGEACRNASIRYGGAHQVDQGLWRARAMTAAVLTGARDTAAGLMIAAAFLAINDANVGRTRGYEHGYEQARLILEELKRLVPDGAPRSQLFARLYHEKRAYSFLEEGTNGAAPRAGGQRCLRSAKAEYVLAQPLTEGDERGGLKVRASLALVHYLLLAYEPAEAIAGAKIPFLAETTTIRDTAAAAGYGDVERWAGTNAAVMDRGEFAGWTPYDVE